MVSKGAGMVWFMPFSSISGDHSFTTLQSFHLRQLKEGGGNRVGWFEKELSHKVACSHHISVIPGVRHDS